MIVQVSHLDEVQFLVKKIQNHAKYFDSVVRKISTAARNELKKETPRDLGITRSKWKNSAKIRDSLYVVENSETSKSGVHSIIDLLNFGHKEIRPKGPWKLFIPISKRAKSESRIFHGTMAALVSMHKGDWKSGEDFRYANKTRAVAGTGFATKILDHSETDMKNDMITKIKKDFL